MTYTVIPESILKQCLAKVRDEAVHDYTHLLATSKQCCSHISRALLTLLEMLKALRVELGEMVPAEDYLWRALPYLAQDVIGECCLSGYRQQ